MSVKKSLFKVFGGFQMFYKKLLCNIQHQSQFKMITVVYYPHCSSLYFLVRSDFVKHTQEQKLYDTAFQIHLNAKTETSLALNLNQCNVFLRLFPEQQSIRRQRVCPYLALAENEGLLFKTFACFVQNATGGNEHLTMFQTTRQNRNKRPIFSAFRLFFKL